MQKPVLIASAALICAAVIGIAVYATGSAKKDAGLVPEGVDDEDGQQQ
ncbi:hypothetical protein, partial [Pseudomonas aeruginosa]